MKIPTRMLKSLIWVYLSLGVVIILTIAFCIFLLPLFWPDAGVSTDILDLNGEESTLLGDHSVPFLEDWSGICEEAAP